MSAASTLINGLSGEKLRWTMQSKAFKEQLARLVGDVLLSTAFLSYSGPFNQEFRQSLLQTWKGLLKNRNIPYTNTIDVVNMLVDTIETSEWALQGLPNDELSLQNAAIVTKAQSYPLLIDPQGQGLGWLVQEESKASRLSGLGVVQPNSDNFKECLELSVCDGLANRVWV